MVGGEPEPGGSPQAGLRFQAAPTLLRQRRHRGLADDVADRLGVISARSRGNPGVFASARARPCSCLHWCLPVSLRACVPAVVRGTGARKRWVEVARRKVRTSGIPAVSRRRWCPKVELGSNVELFVDRI